jgi:hypothetical protein
MGLVDVQIPGIWELDGETHLTRFLGQLCHSVDALGTRVLMVGSEHRGGGLLGQ